MPSCDSGAGSACGAVWCFPSPLFATRWRAASAFGPTIGRAASLGAPRDEFPTHMEAASCAEPARAPADSAPLCRALSLLRPALHLRELPIRFPAAWSIASLLSSCDGREVRPLSLASAGRQTLLGVSMLQEVRSVDEGKGRRTSALLVLAPSLVAGRLISFGLRLSSRLLRLESSPQGVPGGCVCE